MTIPRTGGAGGTAPSASIEALTGDWVQKGCVKTGGQSFRKFLRAHRTGGAEIDYHEGVLTYGGSGNVSVYLAQGRVPTATDNDAKSTRPGSTETVRVAKPVAGTYYIKVVGEAAYSGVSILATQ